MKTICVKNILIVTIIFLIVNISVQPCIAVVQNNERLESNSKPTNPNDAEWFATLQMDISDEIDNQQIDWIEKRFLPVGDYYINLSINFRCPPDRKVFIKSVYEALFISDDGWIVFYDGKNTTTIINGSNPPDINKSRTIYCWSARHAFYMTLRLKGIIRVYEYLRGEWVEIFNDTKEISVHEEVDFSKSRASERTNFLMRFFERFPIFSRLLYFIK